jgi:hypothetical protein
MAKGKIIAINRPGTHGSIERTDDNTFDLYQFQIPQGVSSGYTATANDAVTFNPINDNGKKAIDVAKDTGTNTGGGGIG